MNIKEIDKWLDEEYGCSYTRLEELFNFEIDKQLKLFDKVEQLEKENKQLKEKLSVVNQMDTGNYNKYCEALKENTDLKKQLEYLRSGEYLNQLKFENMLLEDIVQNMEVSKEDKEFIDMTHRNTELLEENQVLKDRINKAIAYIDYYVRIDDEHYDVLKEILKVDNKDGE